MLIFCLSIPANSWYHPHSPTDSPASYGVVSQPDGQDTNTQEDSGFAFESSILDNPPRLISVCGGNASRAGSYEAASLKTSFSRSGVA